MCVQITASNIPSGSGSPSSALSFTLNGEYYTYINSLASNLCSDCPISKLIDAFNSSQNYFSNGVLRYKFRDVVLHF